MFSDFDLEGRVKVPLGYYLVTLYLMRGYFIWLMSLTHRKDPSLILSLIYPDSRTFISALFIGVSGLFVYILFLSKARIWERVERVLWKVSFLLLLMGLLADLTVQVHSLIVNKFVVHWTAPVILLTGIYLIWYWVSSKKVKRFFNHWLASEADVSANQKNKQ